MGFALTPLCFVMAHNGELGSQWLKIIRNEGLSNRRRYLDFPFLGLFMFFGSPSV